MQLFRATFDKNKCNFFRILVQQNLAQDISNSQSILFVYLHVCFSGEVLGCGDYWVMPKIISESCLKGANLRKKRANRGVLQSQRYFLVINILFDWHGSFLIWYFFALTRQQAGTGSKNRDWKADVEIVYLQDYSYSWNCRIFRLGSE